MKKVIHQSIMWYAMTFKDEHSQFTVKINKMYQNLKMYVEDSRLYYFYFYITLYKMIYMFI